MMQTRRVLAGMSAAVLVLVGGASANAAPINVPWSPDDRQDTEVQFESGGTTFYGSFRSPIGATRGAALLLPGSGPTDRNGNQAGGITPNTLAYIADALADTGIATLRFDKTGSGRTGLGGFDPADLPGFVDQVDAAEAALTVLQERTGIDGPAVLGHSEGALTTMSLIERGASTGPVGLLEPPAIRYLDLLSAQVNASFDRGIESGQLTAEEADGNRARLSETVAALRGGQALPYPEDPVLTSIGLSAVNAKFLAEADAVNPVASAVRSDVLLTCSAKDLNISCAQTDGLFETLDGADVDYVRLANASHTLGELGPLPATGLDIYVPLPLSSEFRGALDAWTDRVFG
ncbi:alpha/beta hydrolase [Rhodococcoides yunnanense]|uniref:alpha/beta hydrolase n=1 Tax=Rhodococcoides yunnanense TaxID=278209 RepID=UPI000A071603|nr:alpha/beta hydrolase [Rhodococcus yunnanensis]